jgi:hypothetical protein
MLGDGPDRLEAAVEWSAIAASGGGGDDQLTAAVVRGEEGNDTLAGAAVRGGSGDDRITARGPRPHLFGDDGDDVVTGSAAADEIDPGPGRDAVAAGAGDDRVDDEDQAPGADRLDGGAGTDLLSLRGRDRVVADLSTQSTGDADAVAGFEALAGGAGDDVLLGDDGPNVLYGGGGDDRLVGRGGADELRGAADFDRFDGGGGDDRIFAQNSSLAWGTRGTAMGGFDAEPEPIACGPGRDTVPELAGDLVAADCERLYLGVSPRPARITKRRVTFALPCPRSLRTRRGCAGAIAVARVEHSGPSRSRVVRFRLPRAGGRVSVPTNGLHRGYAIRLRYSRPGYGERLRWLIRARR